MKKGFALMVVAIVLFAGVAYGDNSARIKELTDEANKLLQSKQQLMQKIDQVNVQLIRIDGALAELKNQDIPVKVEEAPAEVK